MKKRLLALSLALGLLVGLSVGALAAGGRRTISVEDMQLSINGEIVTPTNGAGEPIEVFEYKDATYVPLSYLCNLLGVKTAWDPNEPSIAKIVNMPQRFSAEYEMVGTTSAGKPKNDTFIFEGTTDADGVIKTLNFDIIRNKGLEGEFSKKGIMGYQMNTCDAEVTKTDAGWAMPHMDIYAYEDAYNLGQYFMYASTEALTQETKFSELTFSYISYTNRDPITLEMALTAYQYLASEANITLTADTPVVDLLAICGLYKDGAFVEGKNRVSFAGYNGGRSYGEQIDAIVAYILSHNMTLEDVYTMFQTVNQQSTPIQDRDTIAGATISFVGDFQRMVYIAINGELFQGVVGTTPVEGGTRYEVVTQGYAGEVETYVTIDDAGKITSISVRDAQETPTVGGKLYEEGAAFLQTIIDNQDDLGKVDTVAGATFTSKALLSAVQYALDAAQK